VRTRRRRPARRPPAAGAIRALTDLAAEARARAHAPYSKFKVGAALLAASGEIVTGCNIENASYGLTLCAERVAVFKAVSEGFREFDAIAVVADSPRPTAPCGPCRQILWEFCGDIWVHMARPGRKATSYRMSELLPLPFDGRNL
jgi:cytidine deaminase